MDQSAIQSRSMETAPPNRSGSAHQVQTSRSPPIPSSSSSHTSKKAGQPSRQEIQSRFSQWISDWIIDWWGIELVCWVIAAMSLAAILITLESHKNKPLPEWSFGITLNSLISIFATIGQMAMMEPVAECINQLKWLWFIKRERLERFQVFEDASKGPKGSLLLLAKLRRIDIVSLGAAITIASMAFGPFAQQIVTYPSHLHAVENATTPQVFNYTYTSGEKGDPSPEMTAGFYQGLGLQNANLSSVPPSCSTGNCTWGAYSSLAMCAKLSDISSTLVNSTCNITSFNEIFESAGVENPGYPCFNYTLPHGALVSSATGAFGKVIGTSLSNGFNDNLFPGVPFMKIMGIYAALPPKPSSISTFYIIYQPGFSLSINSSLPSPIAYELDINLCVQTYNTTVMKGLVNTTVLSSQILETNVETSYLNNQTATLQGNDTFVPIEGNIFGASANALGAFQDLAITVLNGECFLDPNLGSDVANGPANVTACPFTSSPPFLEAIASVDPLASVTMLWENLITTLTNTLRSGAGGDAALGQFSGKALQPVTFVETEYLWLILPAGLVFLTLIFLLATIIKSQKLGSRVWKSSNLAVFQGLQQDLHTHLGGLSSISEMEKKAKDIQVRLDMRGGKAEKGLEYRLVESKQEEFWRG